MERYVEEILAELEQEGRFDLERSYFQHGKTSIYTHSVQVACFSLYMARRMNLQVDERALARGALLHDYFLYDWHDSENGHHLHGFTHPATALKNAKMDYALNEIEENIIRRHMFPLTPIPPMYTEAWLVCMADKYCALRETVQPFWQAAAVVFRLPSIGAALTRILQTVSDRPS